MSDVVATLRKLVTHHPDERVRDGIDGDWVTVATTEIERVCDEIEALRRVARATADHFADTDAPLGELARNALLFSANGDVK